WAEFRRWVETREPEPPVGRIGREPVEWYEERARTLMLERGTTLRAEKLNVAKEYGFPTWRDLVQAVQRAITEYEDRPSGELGRAFDLLRAHDFEAVEAVLHERPQSAA